MSWIKDAISQSPKIVYTAPEEAYPIVSIVYDPEAEHKWAVLYDNLGDGGDTVEEVEVAMGL